MSGARLILGALFLGLVGACGQKGPLYLPDDGGTVITRPGAPPAEAPAPADPANPPEGTSHRPDEAPSEGTAGPNGTQDAPASGASDAPAGSGGPQDESSERRRAR